MSVEPIEGTLWPILAAMADCLCAELERSPGGSPCFCGVVPGQIVPMDFCDCLDATACGMGWVRLESSFASTRFPVPDQTAATCRSLRAVTMQVGVTRCVPGTDAQGTPPGELSQAEAVRIQMGDMDAMLRAINCCYPTPGKPYMLGRYQPMGPLGNCAGGYYLVTVGV